MKLRAVVFAAAIAVSSSRAYAWEAETTHAGLAEQAALASHLHKKLVEIGFSGGLFEQLTIPRADAPALMEDLKLLSPSNGLVPDGRGRQTAMSWLAAGAALADVPAANGANHFFDPTTGKGWRRPEPGAIGTITDRVRTALTRDAVPATGVPAPDWLVDKHNPLNLDNFLAQLGNAASAATPGERSRHMAAALIAAGAMMHALGDLGAPARVRGDYAAMYTQLGGGPDDLGSRTERMAALVYGRLGVPAPSASVITTRTHLKDFFSNAQGTGLADVISRGYFSSNTLPGPSSVNGDTKPVLARAMPKVPARLFLMAARQEGGVVLRNAAGTCLARYAVEHDTLRWSLDDDCVLEQLAVILPEVASYEAGLLDFLFRGDLTVTVDANVTVSAKGLGAGQLEILGEDERGVRTKLAAMASTGGTGTLPTPPAGVKIVAVFRGADANGEPIVAVGAAPITRAPKE